MTIDEFHTSTNYIVHVGGGRFAGGYARENDAIDRAKRIMSDGLGDYTDISLVEVVKMEVTSDKRVVWKNGESV